MSTKKILLILLVLFLVGFFLVPFLLGVFIYLSNPPLDEFECSSNHPEEINVVSDYFDYDVGRGTKLVDMVITNVTGGQITSVDVDGDNGLFASHDDVLGNLDGDTLDILPIGTSTIPMYAASTPGSYRTGTLTISFIDSSGTNKSALIRCQGKEITVS